MANTVKDKPNFKRSRSNSSRVHGIPRSQVDQLGDILHAGTEKTVVRFKRYLLLTTTVNIEILGFELQVLVLPGFLSNFTWMMEHLWVIYTRFFGGIVEIDFGQLQGLYGVCHQHVKCQTP